MDIIYMNEQDAFDQDVTFNVWGEDIKAQKFILSSRSIVLKVMIDHPMSYVDGKILISDPDITVDDFKAFLQFLYTNECEINRENAEIMLHLGNMYDAPLLLEKCAIFIEGEFTESNIIEYAELGLLYEHQCYLLSRCSTFIVDSHNSNSKFLSQLQEISNNLAIKIAEYCKRENLFTEEKIFKLLINWAKIQCKSTDIEANPPTLKEVLKDIIPFIKFENLKPLTLTTIVLDNELLSEKEVLKIFHSNEAKKVRKRKHPLG